MVCILSFLEGCLSVLFRGCDVVFVVIWGVLNLFFVLLLGRFVVGIFLFFCLDYVMMCVID